MTQPIHLHNRSQLLFNFMFNCIALSNLVIICHVQDAVHELLLEESKECQLYNTKIFTFKLPEALHTTDMPAGHHIGMNTKWCIATS